jgi:hypothetical protein
MRNQGATATQRLLLMSCLHMSHVYTCPFLNANAHTCSHTRLLQRLDFFTRAMHTYTRVRTYAWHCMLTHPHRHGQVRLPGEPESPQRPRHERELQRQRSFKDLLECLDRDPAWRQTYEFPYLVRGAPRDAPMVLDSKAARAQRYGDAAYFVHPSDLWLLRMRRALGLPVVVRPEKMDDDTFGSTVKVSGTPTFMAPDAYDKAWAISVYDDTLLYRMPQAMISYLCHEKARRQSCLCRTRHIASRTCTLMSATYQLICV